MDCVCLDFVVFVGSVAPLKLFRLHLWTQLHCSRRVPVSWSEAPGRQPCDSTFLVSHSALNPSLACVDPILEDVHWELD